VVQYRDAILPLVPLGPGELLTAETVRTIVFRRAGALVGLVVEDIVDIVDASVDRSDDGPTTVIVRDRVTDLLDVDAALGAAEQWLTRTHRATRELESVR
jgi:hypothetical protein